MDGEGRVNLYVLGLLVRTTNTPDSISILYLCSRPVHAEEDHAGRGAQGGAGENGRHMFGIDGWALCVFG
jgi:hypothetical protein